MKPVNSRPQDIKTKKSAQGTLILLLVLVLAAGFGFGLLHGHLKIKLAVHARGEQMQVHDVRSVYAHVHKETSSTLIPTHLSFVACKTLSAHQDCMQDQRLWKGIQSNQKENHGAGCVYSTRCIRDTIRRILGECLKELPCFQCMKVSAFFGVLL